MDKNAQAIGLPRVVRDLWMAQQALTRHYESTGLKFTLDGRLVGDIGEAAALEHFELVLPPKRTKGVDALTKMGKAVQVKSTGSSISGPAFTPGEGVADYLLFFQIDFDSCTAVVVYNGPEAPVRALLPTGSWTGTKVIPLTDIKRLASEVPISASVPFKTAE
jgi:hypothetical protein